MYKVCAVFLMVFIESFKIGKHHWDPPVQLSAHSHCACPLVQLYSSLEHLQGW